MHNNLYLGTLLFEAPLELGLCGGFESITELQIAFNLREQK